MHMHVHVHVHAHVHARMCMRTVHGTCLPRDDRRVGREAERLAHPGYQGDLRIHPSHPRLASRAVKQTLHRVQRAHAAAPRQIVLGQAAVRRLALFHKVSGQE